MGIGSSKLTMPSRTPAVWCSGTVAISSEACRGECSRGDVNVSRYVSLQIERGFAEVAADHGDLQRLGVALRGKGTGLASEGVAGVHRSYDMTAGHRNFALGRSAQIASQCAWLRRKVLRGCRP